jgi:hypothetical protein
MSQYSSKQAGGGALELWIETSSSFFNATFQRESFFIFHLFLRRKHMPQDEHQDDAVNQDRVGDRDERQDDAMNQDQEDDSEDYSEEDEFGPGNDPADFYK